MFKLIVSKFRIDLLSPFRLRDPALILVRISCCKDFSVLTADISFGGANNKALLAWGRASEGLLRLRIARAIAYAHSKAFGRRTEARAARSSASDGSCESIKYSYSIVVTVKWPTTYLSTTNTNTNKYSIVDSDT